MQSETHSITENIHTLRQRQGTSVKVPGLNSRKPEGSRNMRQDNNTIDLHWERRKETYDGGHLDLVERLKRGEAPSLESPLTTPAVRQRAQAKGRAVIYLRVSTEEQARMGGGEEGYSIPYQRESCERYAAERGLEVVAVYSDPGKSGTTLNRDDFRKMFSELETLRITHIIMHKLDRISRSPKVDYYVDEHREKTRTALVSVMEFIDESPQGLLNLQFMRGVAAYYSNNLAAEVKKGISTKLKEGGTPSLAPLGYINKQRKEGRADIRWVELDPERAPHIRWAFEQYATGEWSLKKLSEALEARGLRTRPRTKKAGRPISPSVLHRILVHPYYVGIVVYGGGYYEGAHPALVSRELWLRVQDTLKMKNTAGEKDRTHLHYLKGTIFCGGCGNRLIFSRNKGKMGQYYDYFFCMGRRAKAARCSRKYISVEAVEHGVEDFYRNLYFSPQRLEAIRRTVQEEMSASRADAAFTQSEASRRLRTVRDEQAALLKAHYAGAVPLELLKSEMDRTSREIDAAEKQLSDASRTLEQLDEQLERALTVVSLCREQYAAATTHERRLFNQGLFRKLFIGEDGSVEEADLQETFAGLFMRDERITLAERENAPETAPKRQKASCRPTSARSAPMVEDAHLGVDDWGTRPERRWSPTAVLLSFGRAEKRTPPKLSFGRSSNVAHLAETGGFEPPVRF